MKKIKTITHYMMDRAQQGVLIWTFLLLIGFVPVASALPSLQLDILGGTYDGATETIVASSDPFTLYALLMPSSDTPISDIYYISAALVPMVGAADYGSFIFAGTTINVTTDMVYGIPPLEADLGEDLGDLLPKHGIFPAFFSEFYFTFDLANTSVPYNTIDDAGAGPSGSGSMYYNAFTVDTSGLTPGVAIHFDLYNKETDGTDVDIKAFAPFSHDAQSMGEGFLRFLFRSQPLF